MGKTSKWLKGFLTGGKKKDKDKDTATDTGTKAKENHKDLRYDHYHAMMYESKSGPLPSTAVPKEKRRWSFRRAGRELNFPSAAAAAPGAMPRNRLVDLDTDHWKRLDRSVPTLATPAPSSAMLPRNRSLPERQPPPQLQQHQHQQQQQNMQLHPHLQHHDSVVSSATTEAAVAAITSAQAAATIVRMSAAAGRNPRHGRSAVQDAAAIMIQSVFRGHLARKALRALRGLVKLQALIRGHIVRKQATAALRCMHALVTVQERARAQRILQAEEANIRPQKPTNRRSPSPQNRRFRQQAYEMDRSPEENIKIVEMDLGIKGNWSRNHPVRYSHRAGLRFGDLGHPPSNMDNHYDIWSAASGLTDLSPRTSSGRYEDISYKAVQSSPEYISAITKMDFIEEHMTMARKDDMYTTTNDYSFYPSYMANTESSKAKARSQSAPKQRPDTYDRQTVKRRPATDSKSTPRGVRMQRSTSQVGPAHSGHQYPWSIKLDKSTTSLKDSECGSSSTVTNTDYSRPLVTHGVVRGSRY